MYRDINKRRILLENRKPYNRDVVAFIDEMNLVDMAYSNLRLDGSSLRRENVAAMVKGELVISAGIQEHAKIKNYRTIVSEMQRMTEMGQELSQGTLDRLYSVVTNQKRPEYRLENPVIFQWEYNPPHPKEIEEKLELLMNWISRDGKKYDNPGALETDDLREAPSNFVLRAAYLHNRFLSIYPYSYGNEEIARIILYYYLMVKGYPVFTLNFSEQEYNMAISEYLNKGDIEPFYRGLARSLYNKMEVLMQLTALE